MIITAGVTGTGPIWTACPFAAGATVTRTVTITNPAILNSGHVSLAIQDDTAITSASLKVFECCDCDAPPPPAAFDPCCPPWNSTQLISRLAYQGTTIGQPYTLKFLNTAPLNTQMNAYMAYAQSLGLGFTSLTINFSLWNR